MKTSPRSAGWLAALALVPGLASADLNLKEIGRSSLTMPGENIAAVSRCPNGDVLLLARASATAYRYSAGRLAQQFKVLEVPEAAKATLRLQADIAGDKNGNVYTTATWRDSGGFKSGIFVFDQRGQYTKSILMSPQVDARHIAVDANGNVLILGADPEYFGGRTNLCLLIHKYASDGRRITAYSPCPAGWNVRGGSNVPGPDYGRLRTEIERGRLWTQNGLVYHLMPGQHLVRAFDTAGQQVREILLQPPDPGGSITQPPNPLSVQQELASRALPLSNGGFLVEWLRSETTEGIRGNTRFHTLHDPTGKPISAAQPPLAGSLLLFSDDNGICYLMRKNGTAADLVQLTAGLR